MSESPTGHDALTRLLRELREAAGLSGKEAAEAAAFYPSKISRLERGRTVPAEDDVRLLAQVYRASADDRDRLIRMTRDIKAESRRTLGRRDVGAFQDRIGRLEQQSALIRSFSANVVPGQLQSASYVHALFSSGKIEPEDVDEGIEARLARQRLLSEETASRRFVILMTEGALGWAAGPPAMMIEQVGLILAATFRRNARVGIVPFGRESGVFPLHGWTLFDRRAVIVGTRTATAILTEEADVRAYVELTDEIEKLAVYDDEAREVLARVIARYRALC